MAKAWRKKGKKQRQENALNRLLEKSNQSERDAADIAKLRKRLGRAS
ncbi:hypothetical protein [Hyphomonas sp.]|nr:hypothetical protein [Hyphomonas sp.]|tara:strand:- start:422 stop:562 length:141 start_codon:yes stop_codon:yes gene_type:complete